MPETQEKPVVDPVAMPKIKMDKHNIATANAWAIALSMFLGYSAIFNAIAGFTKGKWTFAIPFFSKFMGTNVAAPTSLLTGLFAVALAVFSLVTLKKVTDAEATKKAWGCISKVFLGFVCVYVIDMIGIAIYSLMSLGRGKSFDQGALWLCSFLPTVICAIGAGAIWLVGKQIAEGKMSVIRIVSIAGIALASVGLVIVFIQQLVSYYSKDSSYDYSDYSSLFKGLEDYLK